MTCQYAKPGSASTPVFTHAVFQPLEGEIKVAHNRTLSQVTDHARSSDRNNNAFSLERASALSHITAMAQPDIFNDIRRLSVVDIRTHAKGTGCGHHLYFY